MIDRKTAVFAAMGFEIVGLVIAAIYIGGWADERFGLKGIGMMGAIGIALAGWIVQLMVLAKKFEKDAELQAASEPEQGPADRR